MASLLLSGVADAQPVELLPYARWHLSYVYSVQAQLTATGQTVDYEGSSSGEVSLEWDMDTVGERRFNGPSKAPTLRYEGTLLDDSTGCGMSELLVGDGLAMCSLPTRLDLGDDGWEVNLGCLEAPVVHTFHWLGPCGPQFDYPIEPVTSWRWHIEDLVQLPAPIARFPYPSSGGVLEGSWGDSAPAFFAPLWTTIGSGAAPIATYHVAYVLTPLDPEDLVLELDDTGTYRDWRPSA